jgi:Flp pilus assembly protein TadG
MIALLRRLRRNRRGITALEFALTAPAMMLLSLGTLEYGRLSWTQEALQSAAVSGARCMGVLAPGCASTGAYSETSTQTYITNAAGAWSVGVTSSQMSLSRTASCGGVNGFSQVTINYTFQTALPLLADALANGVALTVTSCYPNAR